MRLDLAECATGVTKQVTVDTAVLCDLCQGKGTTHADSLRHLRRPRRDTDRAALAARPGHDLTTLSRLRRYRRGHSRPMSPLRGDGRVRARREISVKIPAGVGDGMRVRLAAQGEVGPGGGPAGDLYVEVHEKPHDLFVRDSDDLHCTISVPMVDAALGTTVTVDAIMDGPTEITIPPAPSRGRF